MASNESTEDFVSNETSRDTAESDNSWETAESDTSKEPAENDTSKETAESDTSKETAESDTSKETAELETSKETVESETSRETTENDALLESTVNRMSELTLSYNIPSTLQECSPSSQLHQDVNRNIIDIEIRCLNLFAMLQYEKAIEWYSYGLSLGPDYPRDIFLINRSVCYINTEDYESALNDINEISEMSLFYPEAVAKKAICYIKMNDYEKAKYILESNLERDDERRNIELLLRRTHMLINQRDYGCYNMTLFYETLGKIHDHNIADYKGPVEIKNVGNRGRGLVLTRDVNAGELLLCSSAFSLYFYNIREKTSPEFTLIQSVIEKLTKHPESGRDFYNLWAGEKLGFLDPENEKCVTVDLERIQAVIRYNAKFFEHFDNISSLGLWITESYINDDCIGSNCCVTQYGNVRQVRSVKALKRGDELLMSSRNSLLFLGRRPRFYQMFGCGCDLCVYESLEPETLRMERDSLISSFMEGLWMEGSLQIIRQTMTKIQDLSIISPFQQYYLVAPKVRIGVLFYYKKNFKKAIKVMKDFLSYCQESEISFTYLQLDISVYIFRCYMGLECYKEAALWRDEVQKLVKIFYGCDDLSVFWLSTAQLNVNDNSPPLNSLLTTLNDALKK